MKIPKATVFWIESDPLSGGSASQVEFPLEVGPFFGLPANAPIGYEVQLSVEVAGVLFPPKKMDCHHNDVWRVNLPTQKQGHGGYENSIVCFQRTSAEGVFRLTVIPKEAPMAQSLRRWTRKNGELSNTVRTSGTKRQFGFF